MKAFRMLSDKQRYGQICHAAGDLPLFFQPFWLDAVCAEGRWEGWLALDQEDRPAAVVPVFIRKKFGIPYVTMPPLTPYLGLWLLQEGASEDFSRYQAIADAFIPRLRKFAFVRIKMHPDIDNWMPFYWSGFSQRTYYVQAIDLLPRQEPEQYFNFLKKGVRKSIRAAARKVSVVETQRFEEFFEAFEASFRRRRVRVPVSEAVYRRLHGSLLRHADVHIFKATDKQSQSPCGAIMMCVYQKAGYSLGIGQHYNAAPPGTGQCLQWKAIEKALTGKAVSFNFCGSVDKGVHLFNQGFGARASPYLVLEYRRFGVFYAL